MRQDAEAHTRQFTDSFLPDQGKIKVMNLDIGVITIYLYTVNIVVVGWSNYNYSKNLRLGLTLDRALLRWRVVGADYVTSPIQKCRT